MLENTFGQTHVGGRVCLSRWEIEPVLSSASQPPLVQAETGIPQVPPLIAASDVDKDSYRQMLTR